MTHVVVGVSASSGSPGALLAAAAEARQRDADLIAVQAWRAPRPPASPGGHPPAVSRDADASFAAAEKNLRSQVTRVLGDDARVTCKLVAGTPRAVLLAESTDADLLVLDAPRTGTGSGAQLLVPRLVYAVSCPMLIMPPPRM